MALKVQQVYKALPDKKDKKVKKLYEAMISITESRWAGLGDGHGYLSEREVTITVSSRRSPRPRSGRLLLPDGELGIRRLDRADAAAHGDATQRAHERWSTPARRAG